MLAADEIHRRYYHDDLHQENFITAGNFSEKLFLMINGRELGEP